MSAGIVDPIITVSNLTKRFGTIEVLKNVSLSILPGEIHALCGENGAGKSTLVKILTGIYVADEGRVFVDGAAVTLTNSRQSQALGIAFVAQELSLAPRLSVLDNIWLGAQQVPFFHRRKALRDRARKALEQVGLSSSLLDVPVARLSIGQRQLIEIARMLARDARVLILDEPTATLSDVEIERIFNAVRSLRAEGKAIIYITHRLGEVFEICDRVTVLRNGLLIKTTLVKETNRQELIAMMLGRAFDQVYPKAVAGWGEPMLTVRGLNIPGALMDLSFEAEKGRILCIAGQVGSGAVDAIRALAGLVPGATGEVAVNGAPYKLRSVTAAQRAGIQFVSEDRAGEGVFLRLLVQRNLVATRMADETRFGFLKQKTLRAIARSVAGGIGMDLRRLRSLVGELSGGNQQKVAFGRAIARERPGILLMNEPTRGVDVGARADIYRLIRRACANGYVVVIASSDLEEVLGIGDIIISLYRGRQVGFYRAGEVSMPQVLLDITHPRVAA